MTNILNQINYFKSHKPRVIFQVIKNEVKFQLMFIQNSKQVISVNARLVTTSCSYSLPVFLKKGY